MSERDWQRTKIILKLGHFTTLHTPSTGGSFASISIVFGGGVTVLDEKKNDSIT